MKLAYLQMITSKIMEYVSTKLKSLTLFKILKKHTETEFIQNLFQLTSKKRRREARQRSSFGICSNPQSVRYHPGAFVHVDY